MSAAEAAILALVAARPLGSICPSEAARALDPGDWRGRMAEVHAAARTLAAAGAVEITQRGGPPMPPRAPGAIAGPYRIRGPRPPG